MRASTRCLLVGILVLLALPGSAAKKSKKTKQQKKPVATATPTPTPTPRPGTVLWEAAQAGMTEAEVLGAFPGRAEAAAKTVVSEEGTYVGANLREAKLGDSSFGVEFVFRSPERTLERVTLACTECYGSEFGRVRRTLMDTYGTPVLDEAPSADRRRAIWVVDGLTVQLRWMNLDLSDRRIRVLSVNFLESGNSRTGKD